ncbi:alcohol dehydrogenase catalytic domain-containing protein, partial [Lactobacillus mulieris]
MKAAIFKEKGQMEVVEKPVPELNFENSAIIRTVRASVCGSDLWFFRGIDQEESGKVTGHEAIGIVEKVGPAVKDVKPGDFVIAP